MHVGVEVGGFFRILPSTDSWVLVSLGLCMILLIEGLVWDGRYRAGREYCLLRRDKMSLDLLRGFCYSYDIPSC